MLAQWCRDPGRPTISWGWCARKGPQAQTMLSLLSGCLCWKKIRQNQNCSEGKSKRCADALSSSSPKAKTQAQRKRRNPLTKPELSRVVSFENDRELHYCVLRFWCRRGVVHFSSWKTRCLFLSAHTNKRRCILLCYILIGPLFCKKRHSTNFLCFCMLPFAAAQKLGWTEIGTWLCRISRNFSQKKRSTKKTITRKK